MADTKISALTELAGASVTTADDVLPIVDTSVTTTKKITVDGLKTAMGVQAASTSVSGMVELLTQSEYDSGTDTSRVPTANLNRIALDTEKASTSGTSVDFTSIPAGTRRITIMLVGVSTNGTDNYLVQLGDSGGFENSGYTSACNAVGTSTQTLSSGFLITPSDVQAAAAYHGKVVLTLENSSDNTWVSIGSLYASGGANTLPYSVGSKLLSAELTQVRITTSGGTNTFDGGVINIQYER